MPLHRRFDVARVVRNCHAPTDGTVDSFRYLTATCRYDLLAPHRVPASIILERSVMKPWNEAVKDGVISGAATSTLSTVALAACGQ